LNSTVQSTRKRPQKFYLLQQTLSSRGGVSPADEELLWKAYGFAREAHKGQMRKSGEPYFEHCYQTAKTLAEMNMDVTTVISGLLHDVIEDTKYRQVDVEKEFGAEIARLVEGVTKISGISFRNRQEEQAEHFRKMLLSVAEDIRVLIIKLADRLHNMQTLESLSAVKQRRIAIETRDVYAPLAHRLGMYKLKSDLEDLVLKTLDNEAYRFLQQKIKDRRSERERYIRAFTIPLKRALAEQNIQARIIGRPKHFYSIYKKMKARNKPFEEIYDLLALRVITDSKEACYAILGIVHDLFTPVMDRFKDYIASHKANYYQSIHTTVFGAGGKMVEIQIRTEEMDSIAEEGIAAHWRYKEGRSDPDEIDKYIKWLRDLINVLKTDSVDPADFMETFKIDLFKDEIFVFTPMGDLIRLPKGATPVDFAFEVHTAIGYKCIGAKADGKIIPLNTSLQSGQTVEIITSETHKPSYAWLKFVQTAKASGAIKRYIRKTRLEESIRLGREILEKEDKRHRKVAFLKTVQENLASLGFDEIDKLYVAVSSGVLTVNAIYTKLFPQETATPAAADIEERFLASARRSARGIRLEGITNLMVIFAKCCNPIPGDSIIGFVSRGRGVIIHKSDCTNLPALAPENERFVDVEWDVDRHQSYLAQIKIMAQERKNYLKDVTDVIADSDTNIVSIDGQVNETIIQITLVVEVNNVHHLNRIIAHLQKIQGTISVDRK